MNHSNYILTWLKEFSEKSNSTPYPDNDIRRDFSRFIFSAFDNYYKGCLLLDLSAQINFGNIRFDSTISPSHIEQIRKMSTDEKLYNSYFHSLNRTLLLDGWSSFENCISILRTKLLSEEDQVKLLCFRYREVVELLKGVQIPEKSKESLRVALVNQTFLTSQYREKLIYFLEKQNYITGIKQKTKSFYYSLGGLGILYIPTSFTTERIITLHLAMRSLSSKMVNYFAGRTLSMVRRNFIFHLYRNYAIYAKG